MPRYHNINGNKVQFKFVNGDIDAGTFKLYGVV